MKKIIFAVLGIFVGLAIIGGVLSIVGSVIGFTFWAVGAVIGKVFKLIFTPWVLIAIIIVLAYLLNKKKA